MTRRCIILQYTILDYITLYDVRLYSTTFDSLHCSVLYCDVIVIIGLRDLPGALLDGYLWGLKKPLRRHLEWFFNIMLCACNIVSSSRE